MSLYVGNLPRGLTQKELEAAFGTYGSCRVEMKPGDYAFVNYSRFADAERALDTMSGSHFLMKVRWAARQPLIAPVSSYRGEYSGKSIDREHRKRMLSEDRPRSPLLLEDKRGKLVEEQKMADQSVRTESRADRRCSQCGQLGHSSRECMFVDADYRGPELFETDRSKRPRGASRRHGGGAATWSGQYHDRSFKHGSDRKSADHGHYQDTQVKRCSDVGHRGAGAESGRSVGPTPGARSIKREKSLDRTRHVEVIHKKSRDKRPLVLFCSECGQLGHNSLDCESAVGYVTHENPGGSLVERRSRSPRGRIVENSGKLVESSGSSPKGATSMSTRFEEPTALGHVKRELTLVLESPKASGSVKQELLSPEGDPTGQWLSSLTRFKAFLSGTEDKGIWVRETLKFFDQYRAYMVQNGQSKRAALKESRRFMANNDLMLNKEKRSGAIPGVEIGQRFHYRLQLEMIGLHFAPQAGIDTRADGGQSVATSIVFSGGYGGYDDKFDDGEVVEFTGQGGMDAGRQTADQQLVRGNKAMKNAQDKGYPIRVIRGSPDEESPSKTVYTYAGLYTIFKSGEEIGREGFSVWKFHLRRNPGQQALVLEKL